MSQDVKTLPQSHDPKFFFESILVVSSGSDESDCEPDEKGTAEKSNVRQSTRVGNQSYTRSTKLTPQRPSEPAPASLSVQSPPPVRCSFRRAYQQPQPQQASSPGEGVSGAEGERQRTGLNSAQTSSGKKLYSYRPSFAGTATEPPLASPTAPTPVEREAGRRGVVFAATAATGVCALSETGVRESRAAVSRRNLQAAGPASPPQPRAEAPGGPSSFHALQLAGGDGAIGRNEDSGLVGEEDSGNSVRGGADRGAPNTAASRSPGARLQCPFSPTDCCCVSMTTPAAVAVASEGERHLPCILQCLKAMYTEQQRLKRHVRFLEKQSELQSQQLKKFTAVQATANTASSAPVSDQLSPSAFPVDPFKRVDASPKKQKVKTKAHVVELSAVSKLRDRAEKVLADEVQTPKLRGAARSVRGIADSAAAHSGSSDPLLTEGGTEEAAAVFFRDRTSSEPKTEGEEELVAGENGRVNDSLPRSHSSGKERRKRAEASAQKKTLPDSARCPADVASTVMSSFDATVVQVSAANSSANGDDDNTRVSRSSPRPVQHHHHEKQINGNAYRGRHSEGHGARGHHSTRRRAIRTENSFGGDYDDEEEDDDGVGHRNVVASCFSSYQVREDSVSSISSASCDYADEDDANDTAGVVKQIAGLITGTATAANSAVMDDSGCDESANPAEPRPHASQKAPPLQFSPPSAPSLMSHTKAPSQMPGPALSSLRFNAPPLPAGPLSHLPPTHPTSPMVPASLVAGVSAPIPQPLQNLQARPLSSQALPSVATGRRRGSSSSSNSNSNSGTAGSSSVATIAAPLSPFCASARPPTLSPLVPPIGVMGVAVAAVPMQRRPIVQKGGGRGEAGGALNSLPVNVSLGTECSAISAHARGAGKPTAERRKERALSAAGAGRKRGATPDAHTTSAIVQGTDEVECSAKLAAAQYKSEVNLRALHQQRRV